MAWQFAQVPLAEVWSECQALAKLHFEEVDGGIEPKRKHQPDVKMLQELETLGVLKLFVAKNFGKVEAYITWQLIKDIESKGLFVAHQGAWFAKPGSMIGVKLFRFSLKRLKLLNVKMCFPHHRTQGRGAELGKFFKHLGAKHIQQNYSLWIGD